VNAYLRKPGVSTPQFGRRPCRHRRVARSRLGLHSRWPVRGDELSVDVGAVDEELQYHDRYARLSTRCGLLLPGLARRHDWVRSSTSASRVRVVASTTTTRCGVGPRRLEDCWAAVWDFFGVQADAPYERVLSGREMPGARWFEGATMNYAEHICATRERHHLEDTSAVGSARVRGRANSDVVSRSTRARKARTGCIGWDRIGAAGGRHQWPAMISVAGEFGGESELEVDLRVVADVVDDLVMSVLVSGLRPWYSTLTRSPLA
jgi:Acetyl-coenzyme A synthetase N-terminus